MFPYADLEGNKNQEKGFREICGSLFFYAYNSPCFTDTSIVICKIIVGERIAMPVCAQARNDGGW